MKKLIKKISAAALACVIAAGFMPEVVLADTQRPVTDGLRIIDSTQPTAQVSGMDASRTTTYTMRLQWEVPEDNAGQPPDSISGYEIQYRNASSNGVFSRLSNVTYSPASGAPGSIITSSEIRLPLLDSSVYEFKVVPYHTHLTSTNPPTYTTILATGREMRALFFTDIIIEKPTGFGSDVEVSWVAPTYGGTRVFDRYKVTWARNPAKPMEKSSWYRSADVQVDASNVIRTSYPNGRIKYTCTLKNTEIGVGAPPYSIKVEPSLYLNYNNIPWRDTGKNTTNQNPTFPDATSSSTVSSYSFAHTDYIEREYLSDEFQLQIPLELTEISPTQLRLTWKSGYIDESQYPIRVFEYDPETGLAKEIGRLGAASKDINFWVTDKPNPIRTMQYYIWVGDPEKNDPDLKSMVVTYDPYAIAFEPYTPNITSITQSGTSWQVEWEAFIRDIYTAEDKYFQVGSDKCLDINVDYEIWVTDNMNYFIDGDILESVAKYSPNRLDNMDPDKQTYKTAVTQYTTPGSSKLPLESNKVYYVKIVATRRNTKQESPESLGSFYYPLTGSLPTNPLMMARPPLRVDSVEMNAINISWVTQWYEVYNDHNNPDYGNTDYPEGWYSSIGARKDESGDTVYIYGEQPSQSQGIHDLSAVSLTELDQQQAFARINTLLSINSADDTLPKRFIDITGAGYQIHAAEYDKVVGTSGDANAAAEEYLANINTNGPWRTIIQPGNDVTSWSVTDTDNPSGKVKANTAYVVFFRPISAAVGSAASIPACYPVYVTATTPNDPGSISIDPITPTLKVDTSKTTDRTITVYWELAEGLNYEISYAEMQSQYPSGGVKISSAQITTDGQTYTDPDDDKEYCRYTITGLFANTEYYIWIRSTAGSKASEWSNPVSETTKDIDAPEPPRGLWLASSDVIDEYNAEKKTEFKPLSSDYMILSWMRDYNDIGTETTSTPVGDVLRMDTAALLNSSYMAKFGTLVANRDYYIRAKTILTMIRSGANIKTQYSYCVQVSASEEFTDVLEIYIPSLDPPPALARDMVRKESEWTAPIRIKTLNSSGEYDGEWDERLYPLPESDFEITYNNETGELKYRFRSMGKAADGTNDNGVDQRFITRMIQDRVYIYELDLTKYEGRNVKIRTLEMPYSIVRAMDERKVSLRLIADNLTLTIAPNSLKTAEVNAISDFSAATTSVRYSLEQTTSALAAGEEFASAPHKLSVVVNTPSTIKGLNNLDQDLKVALKLNNRYTTLNKNINTYMSDPNSAGWETVKNTYSDSAGTMTFMTKKVGAYSAVAKSMPSTADGSRLPDSAYTLLTRLNITDLKTFNPNQPINASQFNNIVSAIARNKSSVAIYENMSDADYQALGKSNILVPGSEVSREAGIHALIRLYELKTNSAVKNYGTVATSAYSDISGAKQEYQASLLKAAKLGFFKSPTVSSPKANLTMNDAFEMFAIVIEDAGL